MYASELCPAGGHGLGQLSSEQCTLLIKNKAQYPGYKIQIATTVAGITCLWDSIATESTIKRKHPKHYERMMQSNKVDYSTADGVYCTTHDSKVPLCMPEVSSNKIINHRFRVNNEKGESGIGYDMIISRDMMVQIGLMDNFKHQVLQWVGATVHMKEPSVLLGQSNIAKREVRKVVMQTAELSSTREATKLMVKILESTYVKADLKQVDDNATHMNDE